MPTFELHRDTPLSGREKAMLPGGCEVVEGEEGVLARAIAVHMPLPKLVRLAVAMGRAVPKARFVVLEDSGTSEYGLPKEAVARRKTDDAVRAQLPAKRTFDDDGVAHDDPASPWSQLDLSDIDKAAARFEGHSLDSPGRHRVREMFSSTDPAALAGACRIARITAYRSAVQPIKRLLRHADTRVRLEAVQALGVLAGPGVEPMVRRLAEDNSPEVRAAVADALAGWA